MEEVIQKDNYSEIDFQDKDGILNLVESLAEKKKEFIIGGYDVDAIVNRKTSLPFEPFIPLEHEQTK